MRNIPTEILNRIFIFLSQDDHMECMLVCSHWKNIIEHSSLFQTVRIYSANSLDRFTKKIQKNPIIRCKIERVACYLDPFSEYNLGEFLEQLSNVRTYNGYAAVGCNKRFIANDIKYPWHNVIERISENVHDPITHHLLATSICPNLTVLDVQDSNNELIPFLKNAPALRKLTLRNGEIIFSDINAIHAALPFLSAFSLIDTAIFCQPFDEDTAPAKLITEITMSGTQYYDIQNQIDLLRYINTKYPNLQQFVHESYLRESINDEMDSLNQLAWTSFLQNVRPQLKKLQIRYTEKIQDFLEILDTNRCQIQDLSFDIHALHPVFPKFSQSRQVLYIRTLVLNNLNFSSFDWLKELKVLENLKIQVRKSQPLFRFNLNNLIQNCPETLLSVYLINSDLALEVNNTMQCNIETLTLEHCNLPPKIDWFIRRHLPLLSNLTLKKCQIHLRKLDIKSIDLQTFCLYEPALMNHITALVQTYCNFDQRWYSTRGSKPYYPFIYGNREFSPIDYPSVISRTASEIKEKPSFTLYCHSLKQIFIRR